MMYMYIFWGKITYIQKLFTQETSQSYYTYFTKNSCIKNFFYKIMFTLSYWEATTTFQVDSLKFEVIDKIHLQT